MKMQISIIVDSDLLEYVDRLGSELRKNRSETIEYIINSHSLIK